MCLSVIITLKKLSTNCDEIFVAIRFRTINNYNILLVICRCKNFLKRNFTTAHDCYTAALIRMFAHVDIAYSFKQHLYMVASALWVCM